MLSDANERDASCATTHTGGFTIRTYKLPLNEFVREAELLGTRRLFLLCATTALRKHRGAHQAQPNDRERNEPGLHNR